jgi:hypothetical protein
VTPPYIPPPAAVLNAATDEAIAVWAAALAGPDAWVRLRRSEISGVAAIIAAQFPDVPAADLGRVLASASMALTAICRASDLSGARLAPADLSVMLGLAGAKLAAAGGEITAAQDTLGGGS